MIVIDFTLFDALGYITLEEVPFVTHADIATELFQCSLTFCVNGTDLSWAASIPMVDFARTMFMAAVSLGPDNPQERFISIELEPWWTFRLSDSQVSISREKLAAVGKCDRDELVRATARFGVRVYDALLNAVPVASESTLLSQWYPYSLMRRRMEE